MNEVDALSAFEALSNKDRLAAFRLLATRSPKGMPSGEIAIALGIPPTTMSFHLATLERSGLCRNWREGRRVFYGVDPQNVTRLISFLTQDCCGGRPELCGSNVGHLGSMPARKTPMPDTIYNVLFLCTGNSARSIMAEAILNRRGAGRFRAFSAGSHPKSEPHPYTLDLLRQEGFETSGLRLKNWSEFDTPDQPPMDFIFTVCDSAASESCPIWPGHPVTSHWGIPDPAAAAGTEAERRLAFWNAYRMLNARIDLLLNLPLASLDRLTTKARFEEIGRLNEKEEEQA